MTARADIRLTATDERRLAQLLEEKAGSLDPRALERLEDELVRATIVTSSVSILAPIGAALLGLTVGDLIEWPVPIGRARKLRVVAEEP